MFALASVNVSMINFHGGATGAYTPIGYKNKNFSTPDVRPLYYAMLAFSEATANASRVSSTAVSTSSALIKSWAVRDSNNAERMVFIHKDLNKTSPCAVVVTAAPGYVDSARLRRLV